MKLIDRPSLQNESVPQRIKICYKDGTEKIEDFAVLYGCEIAIYESDNCYANRKETIHICDANVVSVTWLRKDDKNKWLLQWHIMMAKKFIIKPKDEVDELK